MKYLIFIKLTFIALLIAFIIGVAGILYVFSLYNNELPDVKTLKQYLPQMVTRIHASDGQLLAERAAHNRFFLDISYMPNNVKNAFIAAEDQRFMNHYGVDVIGLTRAMIDNVARYLQKKRLHGASTITQQVAKNMLLHTNEVTIERKIKEAILAIRLENNFSKDEILELYLNEIYLGKGAYGVVAASLKYFNKSLDLLTLPEAAYLAALPKGPNNYNPIKHKKAAISRRNWVLKRMYIQQYITKEQYEKAVNSAFSANIYTNVNQDIPSYYYIDTMLQDIQQKAPSFDINLGGFSVRSTLDGTLQQYAVKALQEGLIEYDERHSYRKPAVNIANASNWQNTIPNYLKKATIDKGKLPNWQKVAIIEVEPNIIKVVGEDNNTYLIFSNDFAWPTIQYIDKGKILDYRFQKNFETIFNNGDVILIEATNNGDVYIRQVPEINGAIVALDPYTGRILAMSGGFSYARSKFNRATQAKRQPGSALKPFIYLCALEHNIVSPLDKELDAPIVIDQGAALGVWKPKNYGGGYRFYGLQPLRVGIEKSRNLMTVRLADRLGVEKMKQCVERYKIAQNVPPYLSVSLGAIEVSLLDIVASYASLVNGGQHIDPIYVDRVQDRYGKTLYKGTNSHCADCDNSTANQDTNQGANKEPNNTIETQQTMPHITHESEPIIDANYAYIINDMLQGVVQSGTAKSLQTLGYPLAGKTGTTNDSIDSWFIGFSPNLVVGVYTGFDTPRSLGKKPNGGNETGSSVALPIFKKFMADAVHNKTPRPFRTPPNIVNVRMDKKEWLPASNTSQNTITQPVTREMWETYSQKQQNPEAIKEGIY